jgi:putative flippase GtrA
MTLISTDRTYHPGARPARRPTPRLSAPLLTTAARPLRFAATGLTAGLVQLGLLAVLTGLGWPDLVANLVAFALAAQVNFALSTRFTWRDRLDGRSLWGRWLAFHGAIVGMALVNLAVFALARTALPAVAASAAGIAAAAIGNFVLGDRIVFRAQRLGVGASDAAA